MHSRVRLSVLGGMVGTSVVAAAPYTCVLAQPDRSVLGGQRVKRTVPYLAVAHKQKIDHRASWRRKTLGKAWACCEHVALTEVCLGLALRTGRPRVLIMRET